MATILTKKSDTSSSVPLAADLTNAAGGAELAVNTADKRLYSKTSGDSVVELGTNPSSVTLPNGTANGVPYLNGSKVLTSGSALTFDGTTLSNTASGTLAAIFNRTTSSGPTLDIRVVGNSAGTLGSSTDGNGNLDVAAASGVNLWLRSGSGVNGYTRFDTNGSEQMRLTSTGLGIGTSSPEQRLHVSNTGSPGVAIKFTNSVASAGILSYSSDSFLFYTGNTVRATLDSSGNLLVGQTASQGRVCAAQSGSNDVFRANLGTGGAALTVVGTGSTMTAGYFVTNSSAVAGSITCSNTTATYNTSSDYRLKTVLGSITDSGARIDALEPIEYEWKSDGSRTRGFLAHKFQEVYAGSVTGTKDAVDKDGKPVYQAMQAGSSEVIADLVAEIQSLRKRLAALESK